MITHPVAGSDRTVGSNISGIAMPPVHVAQLQVGSCSDMLNSLYTVTEHSNVTDKNTFCPQR